jgi:hypothetical protein
MKPLFPIILFTYNRPTHTRTTIEALLKNPLASQCDFFVFADGAKNEIDLPKVQEVHQYLQNVSGFRQVHLTLRQENKGLANSVIEGVGKVLENYPAVIVMEDDMICATNFLDFMQEALTKYASHSTIFSVTGYTFPIAFPADYRQDVYLSPRPSSWGWGTWRDRWAKVDWQVQDFHTFIQDKRQRQQFNQGGEDLSVMLLRQQRGEINSWAIRWAYTHFKQGGYCLYPTQSKIRNIGADKSGTHTPATGKYDVDLHDSPYILPALPAPDERVIRHFQYFFRRSFIRKAINWWKYGFRV